MRLLFLCFFSMQLTLLGQNVGIGTNSPSEKLDINGNVNIAGTIKANGVDGQLGQFITKTGDGIGWRTMSTADDTLAVFAATTAGAIQTFTVPQGINKITVELWGGGGAGGTASPGYTGGSAAGGGGGYVKAYFSVTSGSTVNISVGIGATSSSSASGSTITVGSNTITALPGSSSRYSTGYLMDTFFVGRGGLYSASSSFKNFVFAKGNDGETVVYKALPILYLNSVIYANDFTWGKGGNGGNTNSTGGISGQSVGGEYFGGLGLIYHFSEGTSGGVPGGGGGGDRARLNNGGNGLIVIHY